MTTRQQEIERGQQARAILDHPLWSETWAKWESSILQAWAGSPVRDTEAREALYLALQAGQRARKEIETVFQTGQLAHAQLEAENARRKTRST